MKKLRIIKTNEAKEPYHIYQRSNYCFFSCNTLLEKTRTKEEATAYVEGRGKRNIYEGMFENGKRIPENRF